MAKVQEELHKYPAACSCMCLVGQVVHSLLSKILLMTEELAGFGVGIMRRAPQRKGAPEIL